MKLLILGCSSLALRRVTPAASGLGWSVAIASRRPEALEAVARAGARGILGFEAALREPAELVYVATDNRDHFPWVMRALESGRHVIVDKPAFLTLAEAEGAVDVARRRGLCLAEATVFDRHPQFGALRELIAPRRDEYLAVHATFSIPSLPLTDFRMRQARGGGAVNDLGPYAAATIRTLFGCGLPSQTRVIHRRCSSDEVETGFSLLADLGARGVMTATFGFGREYVNRLSVNAPGLLVDLDRVFTIPPAQPGRLVVRERDVVRTVECAPADTFGEFLVEVAKTLSQRSFETHYNDLLTDARSVMALRE
jgi:NDP-hexose-3-ketoreductase